MTKKPTSRTTSKPRSFRFSEEAESILEQQTDAKQFIESLITGTHVRPLEVVPLKQLKELLETMGTPGAFIPENKTSAAELKKPENNLVGSATPKSRTMKDVLSDITRVERERDDILEWSQDPEEHRRVAADCNEKTTLLWAEWRELKNDKESF